MIFAFVFVFRYSWQGCVWLYAVEIAPLEYRHIGAALASCGEWMTAFLTTFAGLIGITNVGWKLWLWILAGDVAGMAFVFFLCPETSHKTLGQIDYLFMKGDMHVGDDDENASIDEKVVSDLKTEEL